VQPPHLPGGGGGGQQGLGGAGATAATRTVMSFGCAVPLGATVLLKGAGLEELARVKRVGGLCAQNSWCVCFVSSFLPIAITELCQWMDRTTSMEITHSKSPEHRRARAEQPVLMPRLGAHRWAATMPHPPRPLLTNTHTGHALCCACRVCRAPGVRLPCGRACSGAGGVGR